MYTFQQSSFKMSRNLAVFDFDHTIINDNSDTAVMNLVDHSKIPKEVKKLHRSDGWTAFMQGVFNTLHEHNIKEECIKELITKLPPVEGMPELIKEINELLNFDVIIISDSNSYFIDLWLEANDLTQNILKVFTNPARFVNSLLQIQMYHLQDSCKLSTKNLCKGQIMEDFIRTQKEEGVTYETIIYCGDGLNDFCPILRLREKDVACVRDKYKCVEMVKTAKEGKHVDEEGVVRTVKSQVCIWNNGFEIGKFKAVLSEGGEMLNFMKNDIMNGLIKNLRN
ncbi:hypothetical protein NQ314_000885 [Rhamnusium bicolor]|uniref:Pyridoxal phosphate phosphatase PHOSPHO2 n=1 Tax=Rhamnusium bicolor TaxID=1586634 RepID=A0AAV8ZTR9_9CUCU|nr:hypothetical protein NQ314_000885 [Rhamnusium bicolor]